LLGPASGFAVVSPFQHTVTIPCG
jgi:hypothetical protein